MITSRLQDKLQLILPSGSVHDIQNPIEALLSYGKASGADLIEIFIESTDNISVLAEQDEITNLSPSFSIGAGIRVFSEGRDSFVSTNDISEKGLKASLDQALEMLDLVKINSHQNKFHGLNKLDDYSINKINWLSHCPGLVEITEKLLNANLLLARDVSHVQVRRSSFSRNWQNVLVAASDGTFARDIRLTESIGMNILASDGQYRSSIGRREGTSANPLNLKEWNPEKTSFEISESAGKMLYADYVNSGQMPIVLANKFGGVIFHEACGHLLETTQIERGTTPFATKINEKIANEAVTAVDEGYSTGAFGSISMDDEGMKPQDTILIENGILKRFISDRAGEIRTGHKRTGSGRRQSYSFAAASRMRNTYIKAGKYKPVELIESIEDGIYCKSMGGGSVGPTGQFNFSVDEAYLIKDGKITSPVKGATLIGEAKEIMPRISMCANDLGLSAGFCGSISGNVNVTVGQPHIKVDSITIGGR